MLRVKSGYFNVDYLLRGGLPEDPGVVVCGCADDVSAFVQHVLWHRLHAGDLCVYGTLSRTREEFCTELVSQGRDVVPFLEADVLRVVDFLSLQDEVAFSPIEKLQLLFSIGRDMLVPQKVYHVLAREFNALRRRHPTRRFLAILDSIDKVVGLLGLDETLQLKGLIDQLLTDTKSLGIGLLCRESASSDTIDVVRNASSLFIELQRDDHGQAQLRVTKDIHARWLML